MSGLNRISIHYDFTSFDQVATGILTMNIGGIIPTYQTAAYLRTLPAIRERCTLVHELAKQGKLEYFDYHPEKELDVANFCVDIMKVCPCICY